MKSVALPVPEDQKCLQMTKKPNSSTSQKEKQSPNNPQSGEEGPQILNTSHVNLFNSKLQTQQPAQSQH